ncbi:hypothetical protein [Streptomyces phytophilus]|uniref:hypothetical protein n=1 Tax=Streptomyces phytophilus TaxID=722715 RepID=UPI00215DB2BE|nr:hypothetical protein [Streptomyces phytophilus]
MRDHLRAFYRGYHAATGRRAQQVRRLHIMREDGKFAGKQGLCGAPGWGVTHSPPVVIDPMPEEPPAGLDWCRACVGHASALAGRLDAHAAEIARISERKAPVPAAAADGPGVARGSSAPAPPSPGASL